MGNSDGFTMAYATKGQNIVSRFDGGYFSFAFGDEIALVIDDCYYILNEGATLFEEIEEKIAGGASKEDLIDFWLEMAKRSEINDWSDSFSELEDKAQ